MAASKKKIVTKDALRRLMKEKQSLSKTTSKRVDHPLAKYNNLDQLVCILCNNVIKNDLLWPAHIQSKQHKDRTLALKTQGPAKPDHLSNTSAKRKADDTAPGPEGKKKKLETNSNSLPSDFFDNSPTPTRDEVRERAKAALLAGYSSSSSGESDDEDDTEAKLRPDSSTAALSSSSSASVSLKNGLPAG